MVRTPRIDKNGMKKGAWSPEEDNKLRAYIERYGHWNWRQLPKFAGLSRCGKSCRLRWMNYLRPDVRRGNYTEEEEETIIKLHEQLGNKWSVIATKLTGRTDNDIKNHWHTHLEKRARRNQSMENVKEQTQPKGEEAKKKREMAQKDVVAAAADVPPQHQPILESSSLSPEPSSSEISSLSSDHQPLGATNWFSEDSHITSLESLAEPIDDFWTEPFLADTSYDNIQSHFMPSPFVDGLLLPPYISCYDDTIDFLDPTMLEIIHC